MAEVVNFNRARKARAKETAKAQAVENRARFGRTRADRSLEAARVDKAARELEGHKRED